jgi:secreted PhoX family phosphatase
MSLFKKITRDSIFDYGYGKTPGLGGTTTFVFDENKQEITNQFLSLVGTYRNCAGGVTPWNSWITCEEDVTVKGEKAEMNHGYNFEVSAFNKNLSSRVPLKAMGRFYHEAVCVDPQTGIVYQTEDRADGLIYRFIPTVKGQLHKGGVLQALAIKEQRECDTRNWEKDLLQVGKAYETEWITLSDVDINDDDLRFRGKALGAAVFARGEGMWFGDKEVFFACTNGGNKKAGQVFKYIPSQSEGEISESDQPGKLILFAEPNNTDILKYCDNLTVAPWGDVVFVEDSSDAHIRGITPEGKIYTIGRNIGSASELAGVCFSPSGKTMFINIQAQGLTFAITGPWSKLRPA